LIGAPTTIAMRKRIIFPTVVVMILAVQGEARAGEPAFAAALTEPTHPIPGALVIVGGGSTPDAVRKRFLELAGGKNARLVVIPTASAKADTPRLLKSFGYWKSQDVASCVLLHTRRRAEANDPNFSRPLSDATGVWLSGGDQSRLTAAYRGTMVERALHDVLARGGVIGGTSAGAAVMSSVMITGGYQPAEVDTGFGFLPGVVVDQHLMRRHRVPRLLGVLTTHPGYFGLGIDEQTAVVIQGRTLQVVGEATVCICFPASGTERPKVDVLHPGDHADLITLSSNAVGRARGLTGRSPLDTPAAGR
jgi:cyanophycinase